MQYRALLSAASLLARITPFENQAQNYVQKHNNPLKLSPPEVASTFGNATVRNKCPYTIYLWSVDEKNNDFETPNAVLRGGGGEHTEVYRQPCPGCGVSLIASRTPEQIDGPGGQITVFEYVIDNNQMHYDISLEDCAQGQNATNCPGHERGLRIDSAEPTCEDPHCLKGTYCVDDAFYNDVPQPPSGRPAPLKTCAGGFLAMDLVFTMCSDEP